jgi:thioredoxin reductase
VDQTRIAIIGAGPHGLAAAAKLRRAGLETRLLGEPMSFWQTMPLGMLLRSNWTASSIAEYDGPLSLDSYCRDSQVRLALPLPLTAFVDYGRWVQQQVAPDVDRRGVVDVQRSAGSYRLLLDDGSILVAQTVVVAAGIADFVHLPEFARGLPDELVSHTSAHRDFSAFRGRSVLVVGLGQSALESAALMRESGADVEVVGRHHRVNWLHGGKYHRRLGRLAPIVYAPTDVGPIGVSRVVAVPGLMRSLPRAVRDPLAARSIRPAGAAWLRDRLADVPVRTGRQIETLEVQGSRTVVRLDDRTTRAVDHVLFGTGYRVDITRYPFLAPDLAGGVRTQDGYPLLKRGMESTVPGLHFVGAAAAHSFGPIMRFVAGGWYASEALARQLGGSPSRLPAPVPAPATPPRRQAT